LFYSTASNVLISKSVVLNTWQEWTFFINWTAQTVDFYLDGVLIAGNVPATAASAAADGFIQLRQNGQTLPNRLSYIDWLKIGTTHAITNNNVVWNAGSKWNSGALSFDGTGDYLTIPDSGDWDVVGSATDNWTIDLQVSHKDHSGNEVYVAQAVDASNQLILYHTDTAGIKWQLIVSGSILMDIRTGNEITDNSWHHVAAIKNGSYYAVYKDGVQGSYFWYPGVNTFAANLTIGDNVQTLPFDGNLDELRIQHSNYFLAAPNSFPVAPLLLIGEGVDEATTMANNGYSGAVTMSGGAKLDNGQKKFNATTSMFFDGSSDYLSVVDTSGTDYDVVASATDSWTIDFWVKHVDATGNQIYIMQYEDGSNYWEVGNFPASGLVFSYWANGVNNNTTFGGAVTDTNWHHIAFVKSGSNYGVYKDGVQYCYNSTTTTDTFPSGIVIGREENSGGRYYFNGYMEQAQITKGNKFGVIPAILRCAFDGSDGDTTDTAETGQTITFAGNTQLDTAQSKFGGTSLLLDGTSDNVTVPDSDLWNLDTMDYTVECWIRFNGLPPSGEITYVMSQYVDSTHWAGIFVQESGGNYWMGYRVRNGGDQGFASRDIGSGLSTGVWYHMAWVRDYANSEIKYYLNGTNISPSVTNSYPQSYGNFAAPLSIGRLTDNTVGINGWIDDFRLYRGWKKYSGNFTVQTTPADITLPTAVLTQDTITVPDKEYSGAVARNQSIIVG
jgi:hypothetical protein